MHKCVYIHIYSLDIYRIVLCLFKVCFIVVSVTDTYERVDLLFKLCDWHEGDPKYSLKGVSE